MALSPPSNGLRATRTGPISGAAAPRLVPRSRTLKCVMGIVPRGVSTIVPWSRRRGANGAGARHPQIARFGTDSPSGDGLIFRRQFPAPVGGKVPTVTSRGPSAAGAQGVENDGDVERFLEPGTNDRWDVAECGDDHGDGAEAQAHPDALSRDAQRAST